MAQEEILALVAGAVVLLILLAGGAAAFFFKGRGVEKHAEQAQQQQPVPGRVRGAGRLAAGARRRRRQAARDGEAEDEDGEEDEVQGRQQAEPQQSYSRKDAYEERRRRKDEEREAQQLAEEQEAARKEAERQAREDAEAAKWLGQISTENEGTGASLAEEEQGVLEKFVDYIVDRKTVVLEELAADFQLRVQDVIARVKSLEEMGRITGVMDDRGKFIYISKSEMEAVAAFIRKKGRVAISELAAKSNTFIDLEPKEGAPPDLAAVQFDFDLDDEDLREES